MDHWLENSPQLRRWLYRVGVVVMALLAYYGVVNDDAVPVWVALIGTLLNCMADTNVPDGTDVSRE